MIEFPLIFGETNFMEAPKIHEIHEICIRRKIYTLQYIFS